MVATWRAAPWPAGAPWHNGTMSQTYEVPPIPASNEGKTVASWVALLGMFGGLLILGVGFALGESVVMLVGGAIVAVALILGAVLRAAGLGQKKRSPSGAHASA